MTELTILQTTGFTDHALHRSGSLESWQHNIGRLAVGNSRLVLAISTALAAPLLCPTNSESGGFHFRGASSTGKSTALEVAGSVWGGGGIRGYIRTWRATSNGLESVAALHCDGLLCLDEMGQVDAKEAGQVAYMLSNGVGKSRAKQDGMARRATEWRLLFLSSGEIGLADKIAEDRRGRKVAAGQQVRIVDVPADAGAGLGLFEELHDFDTGDALARHLKSAIKEHHGYPARAFVKLLVDHFDAIAPRAKAISEAFVADHCPANADGQVKRVAGRLALVAAGGEMATQAGILPWPSLEASDGAARCFKDWLATRGGTEASEDVEAIASVRRFIEAHGESRFQPMGTLEPKDSDGNPIERPIYNRVGFRRIENGRTEYVILPEAWRSEICAGQDPTLVMRVLRQHGYLRVGSDNKPQVPIRLPKTEKQARCYIVFADILGHDASAGNEF